MRLILLIICIIFIEFNCFGANTGGSYISSRLRLSEVSNIVDNDRIRSIPLFTIRGGKKKAKEDKKPIAKM